MGLEDASVLAKLFSHLRNKSQISSFLYAFEEVRQARCIRIKAVDSGNITFMTLPDCEHARVRDQMMRARYEEGKMALGGGDDEGDNGAGSQWSENREIFGYDAEDEADNWWVEWGMLRLRAQATDLSDLTSVGMTTSQEECATSGVE
jgi:salicylate hydroxylase